MIKHFPITRLGMDVYIPLATDSVWTVGQMAKVFTKETC